MGKRTHEMVSIFKSFEWLLKDKPISIDNMTRAMQREMATIIKLQAGQLINIAFREARKVNRVGPRIYDRMLETSILVKNTGTSYRMKLAETRYHQMKTDEVKHS